VLRQGIPGLGISIEQGTEAVPDDGRFYVIVDSAIVFGSSSRARALTEYRNRRESLLVTQGSLAASVRPQGVLRRARADSEASAFLAASYGERKRKGMRKGGKAGRQGYK
jgi:hypothetical protein